MDLFYFAPVATESPPLGQRQPLGGLLKPVFMITQDSVMSRGKTVKFPIYTAEIADHIAAKLVGNKWVDMCIKEVHPEHVEWLRLARTHETENREHLRLIECCTGLVLDASSPEDRALIHTLPTTNDDGYFQMTPDEMQTYYAWYNKRDPIPPGPGVITVTPAFIEDALAKNKDNRTPAPSHIKELMRVIARGHWFLLNQGLGFDRLDRLSDGQQRCVALRNCGCPPVLVQVTRNIPVAGRVYMDSSILKRNALHHLQMEYKLRDVDKTAVSIARCSYMWIYRSREVPTPVRRRGGRVATAAGASQLYPWIMKRRWAFDRIREVPFAWSGPASLPAPILAAFVDRLFELNEFEVTNILSLVVETPVNVTESHSVNALRAFIERWKGIANGGTTCQRMRYFAASEAILSFLEGDKKLFNNEMLNHAHRTLTLADIEARQKCIMAHREITIGRTVRDHPSVDHFADRLITPAKANGRPAPFVMKNP